MKTIQKMLEKDIQNVICEYLQIKNIFFWRQNTLPIFDKNRGTYRSMPKFSLKGVADIIVIKDGKAIFLEVKRPKGKQSEDQKLFEENAKANGAEYHLVTSLDDVMKII